MLTFHRELGACLTLHADAFAMLAYDLLDPSLELRPYDHRCEMIYELTLSLRELHKIVLLAAGEPL